MNLVATFTRQFKTRRQTVSKLGFIGIRSLRKKRILFLFVFSLVCCLFVILIMNHGEHSMDHMMDHGGMDHGDHGGHGDGGSSTTRNCPMIMTFHGGHCERILWKGWLAYTLTEFLFSALAILVVAFAYEGLKFIREYHLRKILKTESDRLRALNSKNCMSEGSSSNTPLHASTELSYWQRIFNTPHIIQTILNLFQIVISYLLMLIFMTFNYWLCLAVVLGLGCGYFVFGWIKQDVYETECCN